MGAVNFRFYCWFEICNLIASSSSCCWDFRICIDKIPEVAKTKVSKPKRYSLSKLRLCHGPLKWLIQTHPHMSTSRRGLAIGSTGTFPGGLVADLARYPFFFFCLPNVSKWSFPIVAFPNKSIINHKSVMSWLAAPRFTSVPCLRQTVFEQSRCVGLEEGEETSRRNS